MLGTSIVLISLFSANRVFSQEDSVPLTHRKIYFQGEMLPDHLLYPVVMVVDRLRLAVADPARAVDISIEYAWQRLEYTEGLLAQGYQSLSFSTLTKAYKYYNAALAQAQSLDTPAEKQQWLIADAQRFARVAEALTVSFTDPEKQELAHLRADQAVLLQPFIDSL